MKLIPLASVRHAARVLPIALWMGVIAACGGDAAEPMASGCVENLDLSCTPAYPPSYETLFSDVFSTSCGAVSSQGSCHYGPTPALAQGGLVLSNVDTAYDALLGRSDGRAHVIPADAECSPLVARLESSDPDYRMPLRSPHLPENVRCVVRQWIANGAPR